MLVQAQVLPEELRAPQDQPPMGEGTVELIRKNTPGWLALLGGYPLFRCFKGTPKGEPPFVAVP